MPHPTPKKGHSGPQFAHVYCGQTAGWIKTPVSTEVGLGPGDIAFDGDRALRTERGTAPPHFGPCLLRPNGRPSQLLHAELLFIKCHQSSNQLKLSLFSCPSTHKQMLKPTGLRCYIIYLRPRSVSVQVCRYYGLVDVITADACTCFPGPGTGLTRLKRVW